MRFVGRIGIVLCLETDTCPFGVSHPAFADFVAPEVVSGVELHTGLGGEHLHVATAFGLVGTCGETKLTNRLVDHIVEIIPHPHLQVRMVGIDGFAHRPWLVETQRRIVHRQEFARGDHAFIDRRDGIGIDDHHMGEYVAVAFAPQVKIPVVGEVHVCRLVGGGMVIDFKLVIGREGKLHRDGTVSGETILAVGAFEVHDHAVALLHGTPHPAGIVDRSGVQGIVPVILL